MDLTQSIRNGRARQKIKRSLERRVFDTVSHLVREYKLGKGFLESMESIDGCLAERRRELLHVKGKKPLEIPPYSLVSQDEYEIVMAIISKLDNPYLQFAHSPEEMILSASLYGADPSVSSRELLDYDFETLLLDRHAKDGQLEDLEKCLGSIE